MTDAEREDMVCRTCCWFRPGKVQGEGVVWGGTCHRYPPTPLLRQENTIHVRLESALPFVGEETWCGEWRPR